MLNEETQAYIVQTARDICDIVHKDQDILFTLHELCDALEEIYGMGMNSRTEDYEDGKEEGYSEGHSEGYYDGNAEGYEEGFRNGVRSVSEDEEEEEDEEI